jgi:hypothetical protein
LAFVQTPPSLGQSPAHLPPLRRRHPLWPPGCGFLRHARP